VDLGERDYPGGRLVTAALAALMQAEGLERAGKSEEDQGRGNEHTDVEVDEAECLEKCMGTGHARIVYRMQLV
jgi:hypothetical protein